MSNTDKLTVISKAFLTKFKTAAALGVSNPLVAITASPDGTIPTVNAEDVYYGDQNKIPRVPSICVEPVDINRSLEGAAATGMTMNDLAVAFLIYHAGLEDQITRMQTDELAEAVVALVHKDLQLNNGGLSPDANLVIHGFCTSFRSGYTFRDKTLFRSSYITWVGKTKTRLS